MLVHFAPAMLEAQRAKSLLFDLEAMTPLADRGQLALRIRRRPALSFFGKFQVSGIDRKLNPGRLL